MKIVTEHVYPPIPVRSFDWVAHYDDPEGPTGSGKTEVEAINDLTDNYPREDEGISYCNSCGDINGVPPPTYKLVIGIIMMISAFLWVIIYLK